MTQPKPTLLHFEEGELVDFNGQEFAIIKPIDLDKVLARNMDTKKVEVMEIQYLAPWSMADKDKASKKTDIDLLDVSDEDWEEARTKLEIIQPMLSRHEWGSGFVGKLAGEVGHSPATLYRWLEDYRNAGSLSVLLPTKRSGGRGHGRICEEVEAIIKDYLDTYYLTEQGRTKADTLEKIRSACEKADLPLPHWNTLNNRIEWQSQREVFEKRNGKRAARQQFDPNEGTVPDANWPLAVVQMDHTLLPIMIVHEKSRKSIGRPWVTLSIDVDSRVVPGMYLSLEHASANSAGMCIAHSILPKEKYLADLGLPHSVTWAIWGVMGVLHMDNAREFRGYMIKEACNEYNIDAQFRPVKTPHYGGHIERLMGTFSEKLKTLEGATFANPVEKGEYDSEVKATMTMEELEKWLVITIAKYHHTPHGGINEEIPIERYRKGLLGGDGRLPRGLPARRLDEEKVRIDFMPFLERTVQSYGVVIEDVYYFADVLRPWVNAADPENPKLKRVFRFRRDPHDISRLYFLDPISKRYFVIPYRDTSLRQISIWEFRAARKAAKAAGIKHLNERIIFKFADMQLEIQADAGLKTKAARREDQRQRNHKKVSAKREKDLPITSRTAKPAMPPEIPGYDPTDTSSFEDND